ncbi:aldehyde dehydrogenase (NADP(+)) [Halomonas sp. McH1-25]|uniref:aldehyde dehydrogenase (NADP(+)) n=1 Tax=unclassified Halomonas TaxID=2609666 RepID=UPI001EF4FE12|nr:MULTISPECIES: aldehyde dehydrogenase (NADP(+)) [unclassified Halomonas]MCG7600614.1 aldehyde dehydrogenase (NADP(+)) [Halomonas sp. McH1-25]MCP1343237.1 aldehyde dehydrogenase (NADP(+)) [Halomonas sp. FL8]MCP1359933.1 aldehyde dehydrogenase (NADP(+)) [Halomonas sp. BBD45]
MTKTILGRQYIAGTRVAEGGHTELYSIDAVTGEAYAQPFYEATPQDVTAAARAAADAFHPFRAMTPEKRAQFLDTVADEIDALGDDFIAEVKRETALPEGRLTGERSRTTNQLRLFATLLRRGDFLGARIDRADPERQPPKPDLRQMKLGLGPVAVFGASNFPLAFSVAGGDTASALAAGCPVVVKAHPGHLVTSELVANAIVRAVEKAGLPNGVFNMIYGDRVGAQLVQEPAIKAVGFTGSQRGGRALFDLANARPEPIPVFAEMSSINPMFLLDTALEQRGDEIAKGLAGSVTMGCGQFCTGPGLIVAQRSPETTRFIETLGEHIRDLPGQTMLNAGILDNYQERIERYKGLAGMQAAAVGPAEENQAAAHLFKAEKALLWSNESPLLEEVFGPSTIVVEVDGPEELVDAARLLDGQLTATIMAEEVDLVRQRGLIEVLEDKVGRLLFNGYPTGVDVCDSMVHGGPYPATTDSRGTSVGTLAIERFLRPVCYQNMPESFLPEPLKSDNPLGLLRLVDGEYTRDALT